MLVSPESVGAYAPPFSVPSYLKFTLAGLPASTVTSCVLVPYFSCQDSTVYLPAGTLSILNEPSDPLTACRPFLEMPMYPRIHGCTSHFHRIMPSSLATYSIGGVFSFGMPLLKTVVAPRYVCTLCRTGSAFLAWIFCPTTAVVMRGVYMQSFWSISTGLEVSAFADPDAPLVTWTQTFSSLPFFTRTEGSVIGFFAQYGSASRCSLTGVGGLPAKSTVPSIDPSAASAASGRAQPRAIAAILSFVIRPLLEVWEPVRTTRADLR